MRDCDRGATSVPLPSAAGYAPTPFVDLLAAFGAGPSSPHRLLQGRRHPNNRRARAASRTDWLLEVHAPVVLSDCAPCKERNAGGHEPDHEDDHQIRVRHFQGPYWLPDLIALPTQPRPRPPLPRPPAAAARGVVGGLAWCLRGLPLGPRLCSRSSTLVRALARLEIFRLARFGTHLPLLSTLSPSHSNGQTRPVRATTASSTAMLGSSVARSSFVSLANCASAARPFVPHCPSISPGVTADPVERRLQASRQRLALRSALHLGLGFATGLVIAGLCLVA